MTVCPLIWTTSSPGSTRPHKRCAPDPNLISDTMCSLHCDADEDEDEYGSPVSNTSPKSASFGLRRTVVIDRLTGVRIIESVFSVIMRSE